LGFAALYAGLAVAVGLFWRRKRLGFAAGLLWSILLSPVLGFAIGLVHKPDTTAAGEDGTRRRRVRWLLPAAILFAVVLLMLVAAVNVAELPGHVTRPARARVDVQRIANDGVEEFRKARGRYPTTQEGLSFLIHEGFLKSNAPDGTLRDPWGRPYVYERPGRVHPDGFDVRSYGADGQPGGSGENADLCNK
jgi:general secretion pathway protein G